MRALSSTLTAVGAAVCLGSLTVAVLSAGQPTPAPTRSTRDGVYTLAQADRGDGVFNARCTECHGVRMWGADWDTKTAGDIYEFISNYMPETAPGTLTANQVRDVLAFILKNNRLPDGAAELPEALSALKQIRMERAPGP